MPQVFQVLKCFKCSVFQVHQTKKSNKFECKLCGEKQSIKRHYGIGTAKECRLHVQKLNGIRKDIDDSKNINSDNSEEDDIKVDSNSNAHNKVQVTDSKWSKFIDKNKEEKNKSADDEKQLINNIEVVLEIPKKRLNKRLVKSNKRSYDCGDDDFTCNDSIVCPKVQKFVPPKIVNNKEILVNTDLLSKNNISASSVTDTEPYNFMPCKAEPKVSSNSRWAQFMDEESDEWDEQENVDKLSINNLNPTKNSSMYYEDSQKTDNNSNSKWAQFVDEVSNEWNEQENTNKFSMNNLNPTKKSSIYYEDSQKSTKKPKWGQFENSIGEENLDKITRNDTIKNNPQDIFALCGDDEIDDVLDL